MTQQKLLAHFLMTQQELLAHGGCKGKPLIELKLQ